MMSQKAIEKLIEHIELLQNIQVIEDEKACMIVNLLKKILNNREAD